MLTPLAIQGFSMAIGLPPTKWDSEVAAWIASKTNPEIEKILGILTWGADEHVLFALVAVLWTAVAVNGSRADRRWASGAALGFGMSAAVPHVAKQIVNRRRPNRVLSRAHGIPKQGKALDSFPSGHAIHLGTLASALGRKLPRWRRPIWTAAAVLAATRVGLLAHYPTDVAAGLAIGAVLDHAVARESVRRPDAGRRRRRHGRGGIRAVACEFSG